MSDLLTALALLLILEGLMPMAFPGHWQRTLQMIAQLPERRLRQIGIGMVVAGLLLLHLVRS